MKHFYKILFSILFLSVTTAEAQRDLTLHFMPRINQSNSSNPAFIPENNISIGLPVLSSLTLDLSHSGFKLRDLLVKGTDDSINIGNNVKNIVDNVLGENNYLSTELTTDLIAVKFKVKGIYLGLNVTERLGFKLSYPKDFMTLVTQGNGGFVDKGTDANIGMAMEGGHYREYGLSGALKIRKFTAGARLKLLTGFANIATERSKMTIHTDPETYAISVLSDFLVNTSLPAIDDSLNPFDAKGYITNFNNTGFGIDLGGTFELNKRFSFAASIIDIGYIKWNSNTTNYQSDIDPAPFEGVSLSSSDSIADMLKNRFKIKETKNAYTTTLTPKVYLSGTFSLTEKDKFGMLFYSEYYNNLHPALTLAYNRTFGNWFTGGLTYSMFNNDFFNIGFGTGLKAGPIQIYVVQDNLLGAFNPRSANNYNMRFGLNIVIGNAKKPTTEAEPKKIKNENE